MGYEDPDLEKDVETGEVVPEGWFDAVANDVNWLAKNRPHAKLIRTTPLTVLDDGDVHAVYFTAEDWDVGGGHTGSSENYVCPVAGIYRVTATLVYESNATGRRAAGWYFNGANTNESASTNAVVNGGSTALVLPVAEFLGAVDDTIAIATLQDSGGDLTIIKAVMMVDWVATEDV